MTEIPRPITIQEFWQQASEPMIKLTIAMRQFSNARSGATLPTIILVSQIEQEVVKSGLDELVKLGFIQRGKPTRQYKDDPGLGKVYTGMAFGEDPEGDRYATPPKTAYFVLKDVLNYDDTRIDREMRDDYGEDWKKQIEVE